MRFPHKTLPTAEHLIATWHAHGRNSEATGRALGVSGNYVCKALRRAGLDPSGEKTRKRAETIARREIKATVKGARVVLGSCASGSK